MLVWAIFEHTTVGRHAVQLGEEIRGETAPRLTSPAPVGLSPSMWVGLKQWEAPTTGSVSPPCSVPCYNDTRVRVGRCTPDGNLIRKSVCRLRRSRRRLFCGLLEKTQLLKGMLASPEMRFAGDRRHASRLMPLPVSCPFLGRRCCGPPTRFLVTAIRMCGSAHVPRSATSYEGALAARAKVVVDVGMGMLSSNRLLEGMVSSAEKRFAGDRHHASPSLSLLVCYPSVGRP